MLEMSDCQLAYNVQNDLKLLLDRALEAVQKYDRDAITPIIRNFHEVRIALQDEASFQLAQALVQGHQIFPLLLEDPYTYHAFTKPRGFAGDASLIDLFYGHRSGSEAKTENGRFVFETLMRLPSCDSVRYRRGYYGAFIDRIAERSQPKVLALACGHLREALFSRAVTDNAVRLIGIDSDPLAVAEAQNSLRRESVEIRNASVIDFIRRRAWGDTYDAIYSAGLFDYLDARIGRKVVTTAFEALRPGGIISVANFLPTIIEQGYMDIVMNWRLIYRTPEDMLELAAEIPADIAKITTWSDPFNSVVYLTISKQEKS